MSCQLTTHIQKKILNNPSPRLFPPSIIITLRRPELNRQETKFLRNFTRVSRSIGLSLSSSTYPYTGRPNEIFAKINRIIKGLMTPTKTSLYYLPFYETSTGSTGHDMLATRSIVVKCLAVVKISTRIRRPGAGPGRYPVASILLWSPGAKDEE